MYALLARRPVFRGKSLAEMLHKQRFEQPEPIRKHVPDCRRNWSRFSANCWRRSRPADSQRRHSGPAAGGDVAVVERRGPRRWKPTPVGFRPARVGTSETAALPPPSDDLPATVDLEKDAKEKSAPTPVPDLGSLAGAKGEGAAVVPPAAVPAGAPSGRFVAVGEDELDPIEEEEPRPVFSWQTGALAGTLLLAGLIAWWALQPPTADALYARITDKTAERRHRRDSPGRPDIRDFLNRYSHDRRARNCASSRRKSSWMTCKAPSTS